MSQFENFEIEKLDVIGGRKDDEKIVCGGSQNGKNSYLDYRCTRPDGAQYHLCDQLISTNDSSNWM